MFENALIESSNALVTRSKYYTVAGFAFWSLVVASLVLMPLLHPEALPPSKLLSTLIAPPVPAPPPPLQVKVEKSNPQPSEFEAPPRILRTVQLQPDSELLPSGPVLTGPADLVGSNGQELLNGIVRNAAVAVSSPAPPQKIAVSLGVMRGNLLVHPDPTYPAIARQARMQGRVVLSATISKTGTITHLTVVSGPPMLAQAALDAVRGWLYKPYLLNGQPVEVQTEVDVNFLLGD